MDKRVDEKILDFINEAEKKETKEPFSVGNLINNLMGAVAKVANVVEGVRS